MITIIISEGTFWFFVCVIILMLLLNVCSIYLRYRVNTLNKRLTFLDNVLKKKKKS